MTLPDDERAVVEACLDEPRQRAFYTLLRGMVPHDLDPKFTLGLCFAAQVAERVFSGVGGSRDGGLLVQVLRDYGITPAAAAKLAGDGDKGLTQVEQQAAARYKDML